MSESLEYKVSVTSDSEYYDSPTYAEFDMSKSDAQEIIRLSRQCADNNWYKIEKFDYRVTYFDEMPEPVDEGEEDELDETDQDLPRVDCCTLNVCDDVFWFAAYIKHTSIHFRTEHQSIAELAKHFGIEIEAGA